MCASCLAFIAPGQPATAAPKDGEKFNDWSARCQTAEDSDQEQCYIFQNLVLKEGGQRVLHIAVMYLRQNNQPAAIVTVPLGVSLPQGVGFQIDEGEKTRFAYERCDASGCTGGLVLTDTLLNSLKKGKQATFSFFSGAGQEIAVPVSLSGFTAGFNALKE
ncbi:MAG: invasion associated locus B family protein [Gammaproteobacteria bacterium]|nr:invasion associated locus B family protein [Gammaproteobacteria bacterium]